LPQPFGPMIDVIRPGGTAKSSASMIVLPS